MNRHWTSFRQMRPLSNSSNAVIHFPIVDNDTRLTLFGQRSMLNATANNPAILTVGRSLPPISPLVTASPTGIDTPSSRFSRQNPRLPALTGSDQRSRRTDRLSGTSKQSEAEADSRKNGSAKKKQVHLPKLNNSKPTVPMQKTYCSVVNLNVVLPLIQHNKSTVQQNGCQRKLSGIKINKICQHESQQQPLKQQISVVDFSSAVTSLAWNTHNTNTSQQRLCDLPRSRFHLPPLVNAPGRQTTIEMAHSMSKPEVKKDKTSCCQPLRGRMKVIGHQVL